MDYVLLRDVNTSSENWVVKVHAVRFCEMIAEQDPPKRQRIDLILIDEEGTAIEARIPELWHKRSGTQLKEDNVYRIKYFSVLPANNSYKAVDHHSMIQSTAYTKIDELKTVPENFPLHAHAAVPFDTMRARINNDMILSDAIVVLAGCSHVKQQRTRQGTKALQNLTVTDGSETISVALWGTHAESFDVDSCIERSKDGTVTMLLCGLTCRTFNDRLSLHVSYLFKCYINPQLPQARQLEQEYGPGHGPIVCLHNPVPAVEQEKVTVARLAMFDNLHLIHENHFIVAAKIKKIASDQSWWYLACATCNRTAQPSGETYKGKNATCSSTAASARYRLAVTAVDALVPLSDNEAPSQSIWFSLVPCQKK